VPTKVIYTEKGISDVVRILGKRLENLGYSLSLTELDCERKMARSLVQTYYAKSGEVIESLDAIKLRHGYNGIQSNLRKYLRFYTKQYANK
jgi:hypothetical protein